MVSNNTATHGRGGGLFVYAGDSEVRGNIIENNTAPEGGGLYVQSGATILGNTIFSNAATYGGGLYLAYAPSYKVPALVSANDILSNSAAFYGGGLYVWDHHARVVGNTLSGNSAVAEGGGVWASHSSLSLEGNTIVDNQTDGNGGGLWLEYGHEALINNVIAGNRAAQAGSGVLIRASHSQLEHNTIARHLVGDGTGVYLYGDPGSPSSAVLTNTILAGNTVGITVTAGHTALLDGTLWGSGVWANDTDWGGAGTVLTGTVNLWGDPVFVDPDAGDYHIGPWSAARDAGIDAGVATDIDGEARPEGGGYDIGADEVYLTSPPPQAIADLAGARSGSDLLLTWSPVTQDVLGDPVTIDHYVVYRRADEPYYVPTPSDVIGTPATPPITDPGVLGDPAHNYSYLVTAVSGLGGESGPSNRLGAFDFALVPANPGERAYNLIAVNQDVPGVTDADTLAGYAGTGVYMVLRHDAATQAIEWRLPGLAGTNFSVQVGDAVYLYLDETAPGVVSLVGEVPAIGTVGFALTPGVPGGSCAYNFISVPLHRADLVDADALAADIGGVYSVSRYNAATQDLTWRIPGVSGENFPVRVGYPYIVCLDETAPPIWP
jgi:hypothetical protein